MKKLKLLAFSTLIVLTLLAPQNIWSMQNPDPVDHHNVKRIVDSHLTRNPVLLDSSKDKDIVVFLGNTGAGKSTFINYLSEKQLKVNNAYGIELVDPNDPSAMVIGCGSTSETFLPKFIQAGTLLFYDLPGFMDTRGTANNLVNACFIKRIIENAKSAKLVFVVGLDQITANRGDSFIKLSRQVKQLIPNKPIENFSSLIITKSYLPKPALSNFITTSLHPEIDQNPDLSILKFWINNGRVDQMSRPMTPLIDPTQRIDILRMFGVMGSDKMENIDISVIYDNNQQLKIKEIYAAEIQDIIERLISQNFQNQGLSTLDKVSLENKKAYMMNSFKQLVFSSISGSSLIELLRPISENLYQSSWHEKEQILTIRIDQMIAQINAEINEKLRQEEERKRIQADQEAKRAILAMLSDSIDRQLTQLRDAKEIWRKWTLNNTKTVNSDFEANYDLMMRIDEHTECIQHGWTSQKFKEHVREAGHILQVNPKLAYWYSSYTINENLRPLMRQWEAASSAYHPRRNEVYW